MPDPPPAPPRQACLYCS